MQAVYIFGNNFYRLSSSEVRLSIMREKLWRLVFLDSPLYGDYPCEHANALQAESLGSFLLVRSSLRILQTLASQTQPVTSWSLIHCDKCLSHKLLLSF